MRAGDKQVRDVILFMCVHARAPLAATFLSTVSRQRNAFDIARVGHGYNHVFALNQIFDIVFEFGIFDGCAARCREFCFYGNEFIAHNAVQFFARSQNRQQFFDFAAQFNQFVMNFFAFQACQAVQTQIQNGIGLLFRQLAHAVNRFVFRIVNQVNQRHNVTRIPSPPHQSRFRFGSVRRFANQFYNRVKVFDRNRQADQQMGAVARFAKVENRATANDFFAEFDKRGNHVAQIHQLRTPAVQSNHVCAEIRL